MLVKAAVEQAPDRAGQGNRLVGDLGGLAGQELEHHQSQRVQVGTGAPFQTVSSTVDSGGVDGTIPFSAPVGTPITVEAPNGQVLYTYTLGESYSPTVISSGLMNTGNLLFQTNPVYINYGADTTTIYMP